MTLIQGAGVDWPGPRIVTYSRPSSAKPPSPLKNSSAGGGAGWRSAARSAAPLVAAVGRRRFLRFRHAVELIGERPALSDQNDPRHRREQGAGFRRNQVGPQHEDAALPSLLADRRRRRLARADQGLERDLQILDVGRRTLVQDHEIHRELLHPPVFVRLQQLAGDVEVFHVGDAQQHDRQVAGNAHGPEPGLSAGAAQDGVGGRPQRRAGIQQMAGETLEQAGFARIDAEMMELHLRLGPGQRGRPLERGGVAMLVDEVEHRLAGCRQPPSRRRCARSRRVRPARGGAARRPDRVRCRPCWTAAGRRSPRSAGGRRGRGRGSGPDRSPPPASPPPRHRRSPDAPPRFPARPATRRRRVASRCPGSARYSVATNSFMKAGCATSSACGASTSSA